MRILAIDPGYDRLGVAVLEGDASKPKVIFSECFVTNRSNNYSERLAQIGDHIRKIIKTYKPERLALETIYFSVNHKTAIKVAEARGVVLAEAGRSNLESYEFNPNEVKVAVTGYGGSKKEAVMKMVKRLTAIHKKALDDEYDAIAIGITTLATIKTKHQ